MSDRVIFKYPLPGLDEPISVTMDPGAQLLHVDDQMNMPTLWASVDPHASEVAWTFIVLPTGAEYDDEGMRHVGTVLMHGGVIVWHVFRYDNPRGI